MVTFICNKYYNDTYRNAVNIYIRKTITYFIPYASIHSFHNLPYLTCSQNIHVETFLSLSYLLI